MLYSKKENAFYVGDELDIDIPDDAIEVSAELESEIRNAVIEGLSFQIKKNKLIIN